MSKPTIGDALMRYLKPVPDTIKYLELDLSYSQVMNIITGRSLNPTVKQKLVELALERAYKEDELLRLYEQNSKVKKRLEEQD